LGVDLTPCEAYEFVVLTVLEDGQPERATALWFAVDDQRLVAVVADRRLVEDLAKESAVLVGFTNARRDLNLQGATATARIVDAIDRGTVTKLLNRKYGWRRRVFRCGFWITRRLGDSWDRKDHFVEITLDEAPTAESIPDENYGPRRS
jgi:hypothetical protein